MAISDVLSESAAEIRQYMREQPGAYGPYRQRIDRLLADMDTLRIQLDTPPLDHPAGEQ